MSWIAEYDTQGMEFPTCVHVTKTTGAMTHGATYVPIEDGRRVRAENAKLREERREYQATIDSLVDECADHKAENAKLRELCADLYAEMITYSNAPNYNASVWAPKLRALGIEVDG